jgi:hypothetical protein
MTTKVMKNGILGSAVLVSAMIGLLANGAAQAHGAEGFHLQGYQFDRQLNAMAPGIATTTALNQHLLNTVCVRNGRCPNLGDPTTALLLLG